MVFYVIHWFYVNFTIRLRKLITIWEFQIEKIQFSSSVRVIDASLYLRDSIQEYLSNIQNIQIQVTPCNPNNMIIYCQTQLLKQKYIWSSKKKYMLNVKHRTLSSTKPEPETTTITNIVSEHPNAKQNMKKL